MLIGRTFTKRIDRTKYYVHLEAHGVGFGTITGSALAFFDGRPILYPTLPHVPDIDFEVLLHQIKRFLIHSDLTVLQVLLGDPG